MVHSNAAGCCQLNAWFKLRSVCLRVILMFGILINSAAAKTADNYPLLSENKTTSEHYEIVKLIDGPIDAVYVIPSSQQAIAQTNSKLWKISLNGEVIDYFNSSGLYSSGLIFEKEGFNDWVLTGDKRIQPYLKTIDANAYSEKQLFEAFNQADIIEFSEDSYESKAFAYLYKQGQAWKLDISSQAEKIDDFYATQSLRKDSNLRFRETDIKASKFKNYQKKNRDLRYLYSSSEASSQWKIKAVGFKKETFHRPMSIIETFFENLLGGIYGNNRDRNYGYPVGYTKYELNVNNERLNFSIFTGDDHDPESAANFLPLIAGEGDPSESKFMVISYRRYNLSELNELSLLPYYENDVGLYVVRKKTLHNKNSAVPAWQLSYSGMHAYDAIWGYSQFAEKNLYPAYFWFWQSRPIPEDRQYFWNGRSAHIASPLLKSLPSSITVHRKDFKADNFFRLASNGRDAWFFGKGDINVDFTLDLDTAELSQAFRQLGDTKETILLDLHLEQNSLGGNLSIIVKNSKKEIALKKVRLSYSGDPYFPHFPNVSQNAVQEKLYLAYETSLMEKNPRKFLDELRIVREKNTITPEVSSIIYYFAQLSVYLNISGKFSENKELVNYYINNIHSLFINKLTDVVQRKNIIVLASQGIFIGGQERDMEFSELVVSIFTKREFNISAETNRSFLFNLACYYAIKGNKPEMLKVIKRALELGKDPNEFLNDSDFGGFLQDRDFLDMVKPQVGA